MALKYRPLPTVAGDIKHPIWEDRKREEDPDAQIWRNLVKIGLATIASFFLLWAFVPKGGGQCIIAEPADGWDTKEFTLDSLKSNKVPLEAHIMSKCPDARASTPFLDCLESLVLPAMQRVVDKVDFTLSFIGTPTDNDGVDCMHGPAECLGNVLELCAASLYPDPKIYLGFTMCLSNEFTEIPEKSLVEECSLEHGIDFSKLNECSVRDDGGFGMSMLRDSVRRSREAGVTKSCTVRLDGETYCVRDNGLWSDCPNGPGVNDLVIAVEKRYRS